MGFKKAAAAPVAWPGSSDHRAPTNALNLPLQNLNLPAQRQHVGGQLGFVAVATDWPDKCLPSHEIIDLGASCFRSIWD
jgi:hypothetical protein